MKMRKTLVLAFMLMNLLGLSGSIVTADNRFARFGAIAYSESTGRFGSSWHLANRSDAEVQAVSLCNRADCRPVVWFRNGCGALARARNGAVVYAWSGASLSDAKLRASNRCTAQWGSCKLICSVCSGGNEP
jgi:serine/threonine-protein kinase